MFPTEIPPAVFECLLPFLSIMVLLIVVWFCLLVAAVAISDEFVLRDHFENNTLAAAPKLFNMLEDYIRVHSSKAVLAEKSICNRSFAVATYACPQAIGNHMHEFLNNFAGAFITNRTLVWRFCTRKPCQLDNEGDCNEFTQRFPWILSMWDMEKRWEEDHCEWRQGHHVVHQLIPQKFRFQTEQILICCGLDPDIFPVARLDYGTLELHEMFALSLPVARLNPDSKARAAELFRNGEDFAYGVLFRSTFLIKDNVRVPNNEMIRSHEESLTHQFNNDPHLRKVTFDSSPPSGPITVKPFYIGMWSSAVLLPFIVFFVGLHIRHSNNDQEEGMDAYGYACVEKTLQYLHSVQAELNEEAAKSNGPRVHRPCVILLASDRKHEIDKWTNSTNVAPLNCTVLVSNHSHAHTAWNEHGPFSGW